MRGLLVIGLLFAALAVVAEDDFKSCLLYRNNYRAPRDTFIHWTFDSYSGIDRSSSNTPGRFLNGTTSFATDSGRKCYKTAKATAQACYSSKQAPVASTNSGPFGSTGSLITVSSWSRRLVTAETTAGWLFFDCVTNPGSHYPLSGGYWDNDNTFWRYSEANVGNAKDVAFPMKDTSTWYYITLVKSNHIFSMWTNGVWVGTNTNDLFDALSTNQYFWAGAQGGRLAPGPYNCGSFEFDEITVFYRDLQPAEISNQFLRAMPH